MAKITTTLSSIGTVIHNNTEGLNEGDYIHLTQLEKDKLDTIGSGAEVNVNADWNATSGDAQILNKPTITGTNTGDQDLQSVTTLGASTTNPIDVNVTGVSNGLQASSQNGKGVYGLSETYIGVEGYSQTGKGIYGSSGTGIGVEGYSEESVGGSFDTDGNTANIANFKKAGVIKTFINNAGELTAQKLIKQGGTSSEILAADGSVITAGNNITIIGGKISSVGGTGGGGSSVNYYLNGGTSQGTFGGATYYEFSKTAVIGTGADFSRGTNGYIASFITDVADPSLLLIPAGNWNLEFFFNSSSAGGSPSFYVELYKYDGTTFTSIASSSATPEGITNGTSIDAYFTALAVPETILTVNDRLAIRVFVNASSKTITLHTQNGHLCEVITTFTAGLTALNGLQAQVQNFATGTTGTDFDIVSSGSTHTFNLPSASATARGVVTTTTQTIAGDKTFTGAIGASNLSNTNTGDNATNTQYSGLATSKQDTLQSTVNIKTINGTSLLGSGDITISVGSGGDMVLADAQTISGLKTFLNGSFGLRNIANTFTSLFTNTATAARTWNFPDKNGTVAMLSDVISLNSENSFTEIQKFTKGVNLVDEQGTTSDGVAIANGERKKLRTRSSPNNIDISNPRFYDFIAEGRMTSPGWYGGINFISQNNTAEVVMMKLETSAGGVATATVLGNLVVQGTFSQALVDLIRNSNSILNAGTYNSLTYNINGIVSSPFRIVEDRVQAGGGTGWHSKRIFYVKSHNDSTDRIAIEMQSQDNGIPLIKLPGIVKPNQMDLSALGAYANDAAAAIGSVPIGYGYINSSTGALQRRLV